MVTQEQKTMSLVLYLLVIFNVWFAPIIFFFMYKEKNDFVYENSKELLNFLIALLIYTTVGCILIFVLIGVILLWALGIATFVFMIIGAIKAYNGEVYRIPLNIRFIK